ncbi:RNA-directed DNA polymerase, eukaryota, nucleotide-binding alpha-beta plait domain protein, partial [Tanacetum coccineum]
MHSRDERRTTQNSGICLPGSDGEMYYGQLEQILEFSYLSFKTVLFQVKWFDTSNKGRIQNFVIRNNITQIKVNGEALMPLGDHAAHWANYLGELVRELPLHYPSWRQMSPERKAGVVAKIGDDDIIDEEDPIPHDLADSDDEDLMSADGRTVTGGEVEVMMSPLISGKGTDEPFGWQEERAGIPPGTRTRLRPSRIRVAPSRSGVALALPFLGANGRGAKGGGVVGLQKIGSAGHNLCGHQQHLQDLQMGKKAALKERYWVPEEDGTYDLERLRRERPSHISEGDNRPGSLSAYDLALCSVLFILDSPGKMETSATREYPSLIHTFFLTLTVGGVFLNPEDKALYMETSATREYPSLIHTFFLTHTVGGVFLNPDDKALYNSLQSNFDQTAKISKSVFISNFPDDCSSRDLWKVCSGYGTVVDVFIPNKRSKAGKRFAFVRFIKVLNFDRLIENLKTIWIGRFHLSANPARFERPKAPIPQKEMSAPSGIASGLKQPIAQHQGGPKGTNFAAILKPSLVLD